MSLPENKEEYFRLLSKEKQLLELLGRWLFKEKYFFKGTHGYYLCVGNTGNVAIPIQVHACMEQLERLDLLLHVGMNMFILHEDVKAFFILHDL